MRRLYFPCVIYSIGADKLQRLPLGTNSLEVAHHVDSSVKETARVIRGVPFSPDPNAKAAKERTQ